MQNKLVNYLKIIAWKDIILLGLLILFELSIQPLTSGPDRRVHDPAVYRLENPNYLVGDWYTDMSIESGVYVFYSKLIHLGQFLHIPEETWRMLLYVICLIVTYYSMIKIGKIFSKSFLVVPIIAVLHAFFITSSPPHWMYGSFIQIDGGLAPRSIGMALSFLSLFFLLKNSKVASWILLGIATLIHVSNSLIVFTLFLAAWIFNKWINNDDKTNRKFLTIAMKEIIAALAIYLVAGGWFALLVAFKGNGGTEVLPDEKFIWSWIYFRAPYMAIPQASIKSWMIFFFHVGAILGGWHLLHRWVESKHRKAINILGFVGLGSVAYFFLFYLFAFIFPWVPGFQFYSIRVIYFAYFVAYLFIGLLSLILFKTWRSKNIANIQSNRRKRAMFGLVSMIIAIVILAIYFSVPGREFAKKSPTNLKNTWFYLKDSKIKYDQTNITKYLYSNPKPFMAPPVWYASTYLPNIASFKSFGFTEIGMAEWYKRMNDVSKGELEKTYKKQVELNKLYPVFIDWKEIYSKLTPEDVLSLSDKYNFDLFISYNDLSYPFPLITEDDNYRLYQLPKN